MFRLLSTTTSRPLLQGLARRSTESMRRRALSTRPTTEPSTMSDVMAANPWSTMLGGMAVGYFVAMYMERTTYKEKFVRDNRHKTLIGSTPAATGVPTTK